MLATKPIHRRLRPILPVVLGFEHHVPLARDIPYSLNFSFGKQEKLWLAASVDLIDMNRLDGVVGHTLWNIQYERRLTIPRSKV